MKCKICESEFTPEKDQKNAHWWVNCYTTESGKLCPPCHKAAKELGGVHRGTPQFVRRLPWGLTIVNRSERVTKDDWLARRQSESWRNWVEINRPEWL